MANPIDKPHTTAELKKDLALAMADVAYAEKEVKEWADRASAARRALESHEREQAKAQLEVERHQKRVDAIINKLKVT